MLCDECYKNPAEIDVTFVTKDGKPVKKHLCKECAAKSGLLSKMAEKKGILELFLEFLKETEIKGDEKLTCPTCNMNWREFRKIGRLGCPTCYIIFNKELEKLIKRLHGTSVYKGKKLQVPPILSELKRMEIIKLKKKLSEAIAEERYEEAAKIRDVLRKYEDKT